MHCMQYGCEGLQICPHRRNKRLKKVDKEFSKRRSRIIDKEQTKKCAHGKPELDGHRIRVHQGLH